MNVGPSEIEQESLPDFLARAEVTPEIYATLRSLHHGGRRPDDVSARLWSLVRGFQPVVHVGSIRDQMLATKEFPADTFHEVKAALRHLEAGLKEFGTHAIKPLILRPKRERLAAALKLAPPPPALLAKRIEAALAAAN